jgi:hypothetical protein
MSDNYKATLYTAIVIGIVLVAVGALIHYRSTSIKPESTFDINHPASQSATTVTAEPLIDAWRTYINSSYNFSVDVPSEWKEQGYPAPLPSGSFLVAFGPDKLPCRTCTYFRNGYYSVKIYNQTTDPDYFKDFEGRMANVGKSKDFIGLTLGEYKGVLNGNTVAFDHKDWIYELNLDANNGSMSINDSKIFQRAVNSFKFTGLLFNK